MIRSIILIGLVFWSFQMRSQESEFSNLGEITDAFYSALSESDSAKRSDQFSKLFTKNAQITAVVDRGGLSKTKNGTWQEFLQKSNSFYQSYAPTYLELEREVEYYLDLATVHSIAQQTATDKSTGKIHQQEMWIQLDLVFQSNRWFIANAIWTHQIGSIQINKALLQDTLWHNESTD